ncbi:unnamed protein product [Brassicogethes aeneus]|uniref:Uncharacterized protein n=1 Tax=Brassicogethes aeneus TaxID=1431903 RepID=A0A9P0BH91_BRAAE|nr:unnamed protein product [Brassicogethes aeneus]
MTHYWWMHWFWITSFYVLTTAVTVSTIHSTSKQKNTNDTFRAAKSIEIQTTTDSTTTLKHTNTTTAEIIKPSLKKIDLVLKVNTSKSFEINRNNMTVIKGKNLTETCVNLTDNQMQINASSFNTDNLTYVDDFSINATQVSALETNEVEKASLEADLSGNLSAAGITGITLGCVVIVGLICGVSYFLYRNRSFNRPQVLNDRCSNPDSSGYIDDASVRDNSEEMYSLDNDSFLNSLEAMTIQNYWTDTVKHTKL